MAKTAIRARAVKTIEARIVATSGLAVGDQYPGASLTTLYVARLARQLVGQTFKIDPVAMIAYDRGPRDVAFGRSLAMHLTHIVGGRRHEEVATAFRRNRSTASHHFEVFENLREVQDFDGFLDILEHQFALLLVLAEKRPYQAWGKALEAMAAAVNAGTLEADAHFDAKFVVATFKVVPKPAK